MIDPMSANVSAMTLDVVNTDLPSPAPRGVLGELREQFRQYDIRGVVSPDLLRHRIKQGDILTSETRHLEWPERAELSLSLAYAVGCAYGAEILEKHVSKTKKLNIAIAYDARLSGPALCEALERGLRRMGLNVIKLGLVPTPVVYFATYEFSDEKEDETVHNGIICHGGIAVTGSHNPSSWNGFKMSFGHDSVYGDALQKLAHRVLEGDYSVHGVVPQAQETSAIVLDLSEHYLESVLDRLCLDDLSRLKELKVVIDAGHGASGPLAERFFKRCGVELRSLYCEPNGLFPAHHPDPTVEKNLDDLKRAVTEWGADLGLAFDGDGDRLGVVDRKGVVLWGDQLLLLFAERILAESPGSRIIGEVKCSEILYDGVRRAGGIAEMWKVGHSLIKSRMKETGAPLAGEMSGHLFFADRFYGFDDAIYAGGRLLERLIETEFDLSDWREALPLTYNTPELRVYCPDEYKNTVIDRFSEDFSKRFPLETIDGVRVKFSEGWGLVRSSNTQPVLVMRFEANSPDELASYRDQVETWLKEEAPEVSFELDPNHN